MSLVGRFRSRFLTLNKEGTKLEYRTGKLVMVKAAPKDDEDVKSPSSPIPTEVEMIPTIEQSVNGSWDISVNIKKILMTPFRTKSDMPIIQYTIRDENNVEYIVYSKNKSGGMKSLLCPSLEDENDFSPDVSGAQGKVQLEEGETVGEIAWQQIQKDQISLMAIRTNYVCDSAGPHS